jgi:hypothetical protein
MHVVCLDLKPALTGTISGVPDDHDEEMPMDTARDTGQDNAPVIACELGGDEIGAQAERWIRLGRDAGLKRVGTEDGLQIRFRDQPAVEEELRALVAVESKCCSWARWEVRRADGDLILTVSSTPEGAATLHTMFGTGLRMLRVVIRRVGELARGEPDGSAAQGAHPSSVFGLGCTGLMRDQRPHESVPPLQRSSGAVHLLVVSPQPLPGRSPPIRAGLR